MESYLVAQRKQVFSNVGVLIYVFDVESREFERDLITYSSIIRALKEYSPMSTVFCLIHKMDLIQPIHRERLFEERISFVRERSEGFEVAAFATSIWDQTLYKAWASIMYILIPNIEVIDDYLAALLQQMDADEIVLFERTTFLVVTSVMSVKGNRNSMGDRFEKLSNIIKTFKHSAAWVHPIVWKIKVLTALLVATTLVIHRPHHNSANSSSRCPAFPCSLQR